MSKIIIVGMGPGGVSAAIYLKRFGFEPECFENALIGGKVNYTPLIENYPGFRGTGMELGNIFAEQANDFALDIKYEVITAIEKIGNSFEITTDAERKITADAVIIATGVKDKTLKIPGTEKFKGVGISSCAVCDGPLFKNKDVGVVGSNSGALEATIYLASICHQVYLINNRKEFNGFDQLLSEIKKLSNVEIIEKNEIVNVDGESKIQTITVSEEGKERTIKIAALFTYIGSVPATEFIKIPDIFTKSGFIETNESMETKVPGLFAIGDIRATAFRQIATAVSDGAISSLAVKKYLRNGGTS